MIVDYDSYADILYIKLRDSEIVETRMLGRDVYVDVDKDDKFVGIEMWKVSCNEYYQYLKYSNDSENNFQIPMQNLVVENVH